MKSNKKVYFTDDGDAVVAENKPETEEVFDENGETSQKSKNKHHKSKNVTDTNFDKRWFELFEEYNTSGEVKDMKDSELTALRNHCKSCFEEESQKQVKSMLNNHAL